MLRPYGSIMLKTRFVILSQDDCPRCERLKMMLAQPLRGRYQGDLTVIHRQTQPELFKTLAEIYSVSSTPVIIHQASGKVLSAVESLLSVRTFLHS